MKRLLLLLALVSLCFTLPTILSLNDQSFAVRGCCKERRSLSSDDWNENGYSFRKCRDLNKKKDNDDLYKKRGYLYWDENC